MASCISLVTMAILAVVLLSPVSAEGRQKSLETVGNAALDVPARQVRREARSKKGGKRGRKVGKKEKKGRKKGRKAAKGTNGRKTKHQRKNNDKSARRNNPGRQKKQRKNKLAIKQTKQYAQRKGKTNRDSRAESKFDHCDYLDLMEVGTRRADCGTGGKFLFKVGFYICLLFPSYLVSFPIKVYIYSFCLLSTFLSKAKPGVRRQFLMLANTNIVAFLKHGRKIGNCTTMNDITEKVKCKVIWHVFCRPCKILLNQLDKLNYCFTFTLPIETEDLLTCLLISLLIWCLKSLLSILSRKISCVFNKIII